MIKKNISIKCFLYLFSSIVLCSFILGGCTPQYRVDSISSPGVTSIQLLTNRSLSTLNDRLTIFEDQLYVSPTPRFTVFNRTEQALTIFMTGQSGSYTYVVEPKRDETWLINIGTYHIELSLPGLPTAAADNVNINAFKKYQWEIWRSEY